MWKINEENVTGTDIYHYQVSIGSALKLGPTVAYLEWTGLGEQSLKAGISVAW
jgi:hypothetical protein